VWAGIIAIIQTDRRRRRRNIAGTRAGKRQAGVSRQIAVRSDLLHTTGLLINPVIFVRGIFDDFPLVAGIAGALLVGKGIAAWIAGWAFGYARDKVLTMWSLTLPQVAATLAATLVAYQTRDAGVERLLGDHCSTPFLC
jgi:hypothetical protein